MSRAPPSIKTGHVPLRASKTYCVTIPCGLQIFAQIIAPTPLEHVTPPVALNRLNTVYVL